jgi:hypothetical protein
MRSIYTIFHPHWAITTFLKEALAADPPIDSFPLSPVRLWISVMHNLHFSKRDITSFIDDFSAGILEGWGMHDDHNTYVYLFGFTNPEEKPSGRTRGTVSLFICFFPRGRGPPHHHGCAVF